METNWQKEVNAERWRWRERRREELRDGWRLGRQRGALDRSRGITQWGEKKLEGNRIVGGVSREGRKEEETPKDEVDTL